MSAKKNIGQLAAEIYSSLEGQTLEDSHKILTTVSILLGGTGISPAQGQPAGTTHPLFAGNQNPPMVQMDDAKAFFKQKDPQNKGEEFVVAAVFRELNNQGNAHTKDDLRTIIKSQAARKFDDKNFNRDIQNATRQAGFFLPGENKGEYTVSSYGEDYVAALPDRAAAGQIKRPSKKAPNKKKTKAKKASKAK
ncbi:MAG: hypothetical protein GC185_08305 [Alphaproteobacteria bacterium]|nr:hypothetical protein [Alphaproteobacteria bacterium]